MSREERTRFFYGIAGLLWMVLSHKHASLRFGRLYRFVKEALSCYEKDLYALPASSHCFGYFDLLEKGFLKEKHWRFGVFMASATSLPILYRKARSHHIINAICAKTSIGASAKLLDNLNDTIHSHDEAISSLLQYESALNTGTYRRQGGSDVLRAEGTADEIATWTYRYIPNASQLSQYRKDVGILIEGQVASLKHKKERYPSMKEYLSLICERSIGNLWIDVDLAFMEEAVPSSEVHLLKEGNDHVFKSYLIYDDIQDIYEDLKINSVNSAIILALEQGVLSESDIEGGNREVIIETLESEGIFSDLMVLGDLIFLKGLEIISRCNNPIDRSGLVASFALIRMFNIRKVLRRERNVTILTAFLANYRSLKKIRNSAPPYIHELMEYVG
ncbi:MAG: hypothetical protein HXS53_04130 [Theionarchaea archaeon]|nr:hypothetical protein [Theionarchaea archaeon]